MTRSELADRLERRATAEGEHVAEGCTAWATVPTDELRKAAAALREIDTAASESITDADITTALEAWFGTVENVAQIGHARDGMGRALVASVGTRLARLVKMEQRAQTAERVGEEHRGSNYYDGFRDAADYILRSNDPNGEFA